MGNSSNKTGPTGASVDAFVGAVADPQQRADARTLIDLMQRLSGEPPYMWGPTIIGFGTYHYKYVSGREGDAGRIGFSPRKGQIVIYVVDGFPDHTNIMARLGKHKTGKSCLYVKRLTDVNMDVLEELCSASLAVMDERYPRI